MLVDLKIKNARITRDTSYDGWVALEVTTASGNVVSLPIDRNWEEDYEIGVKYNPEERSDGGVNLGKLLG